MELIRWGIFPMWIHPLNVCPSPHLFSSRNSSRPQLIKSLTLWDLCRRDGVSQHTSCLHVVLQIKNNIIYMHVCVWSTEKRTDSNGRMYFVHHTTRSTQWEDPRTQGWDAVTYKNTTVYNYKNSFFIYTFM